MSEYKCISTNIELGNIHIAKMLGGHVQRQPEEEFTYRYNVMLSREFKETVNAPTMQMEDHELKFHCDYNWLIYALRFFFNWVEQEKKNKWNLTDLKIKATILTPMALNWKKYHQKFLKGDINGLFEDFVPFAIKYNEIHNNK